MTKTKIFKGIAVGLIILLAALSFYIFGDDSQVLFANASACLLYTSNQNYRWRNLCYRL